MTKTFDYSFVSLIPTTLEHNKIYISIDYNIAVHNCACGCGEEVVTPLSPNDWKLIYDGETISLSPSIGNWSYKCRSHYWIKENKIVWAETWSDQKVSQVRAHEKKRIEDEKEHRKKKKGLISLLRSLFK